MSIEYKYGCIFLQSAVGCTPPASRLMFAYYNDWSTITNLKRTHELIEHAEDTPPGGPHPQRGHTQGLGPKWSDLQ
jgi:hypothetical protein